MKYAPNSVLDLFYQKNDDTALAKTPVFQAAE
jgi:hypothetical protein